VTRLRPALPSILSIAVSLVVCLIAIAVTLGSPLTALEAYAGMFWGAFGDWPKFFAKGDPAQVLRPLGEAGTKAALLTFTGLSVAVAFRVGLFNIGAQGQMMAGAIAAAVVGAQVELPALLHVTLCVLAAALAGALYALPAAILKVKRGVHEVISTIMLNWIAVSLVENWLVVGPLRATAHGDNSISGTAQIHETAALPLLLGNGSRLNLGFLFALTAAVFCFFFLARTVRGFEWRTVGLSPDAALAAGIPIGRRLVEAMLVAGGLAGVAGAILVLGTEQKYPATLGAPYGFDGIAMALIGQGNPLGVLASALLFGGLRAGGTRMQLLGVHKSFPELIQGLALLLVAAKYLWDRLLTRRVKHA
jgi:general nucleoside transport system permease protein